MRILWFTNTSSLYEREKHIYNGGGWIESLEILLRERFDVELAVSFLHIKDDGKKTVDNKIYYPISRTDNKSNFLSKITNRFSPKLESEIYLKKMLDVVEDFKPDLIHVFGTEGPYALIQEYTNIPILVHIQGLVNPYLNHFFPVGYSKFNLYFSKYFYLKNIIGRSPIFGYKRFKLLAEREQRIFSNIKYVSGRTEWDKSIVELFNSNAKYFHLDEVLRSEFYNNYEDKNNKNSKLIIISTVSPTIYKGLDVILKTCKLLKDITNIDFEWKIVGIDDKSELLKMIQLKENISCKSVNIKLLGILNTRQLIGELHSSNIYIHPSYIDNSPNSVCEAQILGLPVIACNVGGISSLIEHKKTGFLVPSNGIFEIVYYIKKLTNNKSVMDFIKNNSRVIASNRHDRVRIIEELIISYSKIIRY